MYYQRAHFYVVLSLVFLVGCVNYGGNLPASGTQVKSKSTAVNTLSVAERNQLQEEMTQVQERIAECSRKELNTRDGRTVNSQILALSENNPVANRLMVSGQRITSAQKASLQRYIKQTEYCRAIAQQIKQERLLAVYTRYFAGVDVVYGDLLNGKSTIGQANQRMQNLKLAARTQWAQAINSINGF
jgi:outer membrane murein-binding lipoprotein Lpp